MILLLTSLDSGCAKAFRSPRGIYPARINTPLHSPSGFPLWKKNMFFACVFGHISTFADL